jgi:thymidylate kinase
VSLEFGCYLIRRICKGGLDEEQGRRLSRLYQENPAGCEREVSRFWKADSAALIISAAQSGNWQPVRNCLENLSSDLRRAARPRPWRASADRLRHFGGRLKRALRPDGGLDVIVLGPDGAGKSSVVGAMRETLAGAFNGTVCYRFPPGLLGRLLGRPAVPDTRPHASRPRSFLSSAFRAVFYWFLYGTLGYCATVRLDLARSRLVLHDRHFVDALVDPRRYRYGGPLWLLRLIWRFLPKPDLVILLDAPPEVLQGRKQEVPLAETARQREAYLALAGKMTNAHVLNAARPLEQVVADVDEIILRQMAARSVRRLGLEQNA